MFCVHIFGGILKNIITLIVICIISVFTSNAAFAANNVLNSLSIYSDNSNYSISLNTLKKASFNYSVSSSDKITLKIKNVVLSEDFNTVYDNSSKIAGVIIEPSGRDVKININGRDISGVKVKNTPQIIGKPGIVFYVNKYLPFSDNQRNLILILVFAGFLIINASRKNQSGIYNSVINSDSIYKKEIDWLKTTISSVKEALSVQNSIISSEIKPICNPKLLNLTQLENVEKHTESSFVDNSSYEEKIIYKTPALSKLGGMTNVCTKIMSPQLSALERARVITTKTKTDEINNLNVMTKI